jgi:hypothetical protein
LRRRLATGLDPVVVAAQFHARDALQAASCRIPELDPGSDPGTATDPEQVRRCRAQAASMMRQADSGLRTLLRMQAERQKAEDAARPAAMQRAGYWFRSVSPAEPANPPADPPPEPLAASPELPRAPTLAEPHPLGLPEQEYGAMTPAERYVTLYPDRAAAILASGGLPARLTFTPPRSRAHRRTPRQQQPGDPRLRQANGLVAA